MDETTKNEIMELWDKFANQKEKTLKDPTPNNIKELREIHDKLSLRMKEIMPEIIEFIKKHT